jgi:predicted extracellular nuclease
LVISEFRTRGPNGASDEFVEIYNKSDQPVDASGMKIRGSSGGGTITTRLTINTNTAIPSRGHFLATNSSGYSGSITGDQSFTSGIANDGGIALTLPDDTIIDQLGLGPGSAFKEGMHLAPLPTDANQSYERKPGGPLGSTQDTQENSNDFQLVSPSDPQNTHSNPTPGATPSPTPSPTPTISPTPTPTPNSSPSPSPTPGAIEGVVISQVFGGGGNSGAPIRNDFIELFNAGKTAVNLAGWSVQYASATTTTWSVTNLSSALLAPGQYYLIQEASGGSNGVTLPTPDATGTISLAATAGKVALVKATTALSGTCPSDASLIDLVGYGGSATCFEGTTPAPAPSNSTAIVRADGGCTDSATNSNDFSTAPPNPRNMSSATHLCTVALTNDWLRDCLASILFKALIVTTCRGAPL